MLDFSDYYSNGVDFEGIKNRINADWAKNGLKDRDLRVSYAAMLSKEQSEQLSNQAAGVNAQTHRLLSRGGVFTKRALKRCDDKILGLINAGLDLNAAVSVGDKKVNLLNQAIRMMDYSRISLLLAAGAKPQFSDVNPSEDTLILAAYTGDLTTVGMVLSFIEKPLPKSTYWLVGLLHSTQNPAEYIMGEMIARRSEELGDNYDSLMQSSLKVFPRACKVSKSA